MVELRWVLLGLGLVLVTGVYLWGRGLFRRNQLARISRRRRAEPHISDARLATSDGVEAPVHAEPDIGEGAEVAWTSLSEEDEPQVEPEPAPPPPAPEKIVTVRFIPKASELSGEEAVLALREAGLRHGRYGIFHLHDETHADEAQFSVASLTEPGSFDLENLSTKPISGMSFFMVLPGLGDPVARFDAMVQTAHSLARKLDAELFDDRGSSWSIQRERYVREEIIRYRHQLAQD